MSELAQLQAFLAAVVCIAIFICALASAGLSYKGESNTSKALFFICVVMVLANAIITAHILVITFTMAAGMAGWIMAVVLRHVYGVPRVQ